MDKILKVATFTSKYKEEVPLDVRRSECDRILKMYADRIPVVMERDENSTMASLKNRKFALQNNLTISQLTSDVQVRLQIESEDDVHLYVNGEPQVPNATLKELYERYKEEDGILYVVYSDTDPLSFAADRLMQLKIE